MKHPHEGKQRSDQRGDTAHYYCGRRELRSRAIPRCLIWHIEEQLYQDRNLSVLAVMFAVDHVLPDPAGDQMKYIVNISKLLPIPFEVTSSSDFSKLQKSVITQISSI